MKNVGNEYKIYKVALLVAMACVLQISESLIPHPIPGLRLGLANMLTLTAMVTLGFGYALEVALLRVILSAFIMGVFMSPTFILSFGGALASTLVMGFFYWLSGLSRCCRLSIIGISIIGAFTHNMVQLYLAYLLLIKHGGIFMFFPWLSIGAIATGFIVGIVAGGVCRRLQSAPGTFSLDAVPAPQPDLQLRLYEPGDTWLHRLPAPAKLTALILLALAALFTDHTMVYLAMFGLLGMVVLLSRTPLRFCYTAVRRYRILMLIAFVMPLFWTPADRAVITLGFFRISVEGLRLGASFATRIFLLVLCSALVMRTTGPRDLAEGLAWLLRPLKIFGIDPARIAQILSLSWTVLPRLWETGRATMMSANISKTGNLRCLLPLLMDLIARLYLQTEPASSMWQPNGWVAEKKYADPEV